MKPNEKRRKKADVSLVLLAFENHSINSITALRTHTKGYRFIFQMKYEVNISEVQQIK